jgi:hypothetical protein
MGISPGKIGSLIRLHERNGIFRRENVLILLEHVFLLPASFLPPRRHGKGLLPGSNFLDKRNQER